MTLNTKYTGKHSRLFFLFLLMVLLFLLPKSSFAKGISIVTFPYPPYSMQNGNGLLEQVVSAAFEAQEEKAQFQYFPHQRAVLYFKSGDIPVYMGAHQAVKTKKISKVDFFIYRRVLTYWKNQFDNKPVKSIKAFKNMVVGIPFTSSQVPLLGEAGMKIMTTPKNENTFKMFLLNRMDVMYSIELAAMKEIEKQIPDRFNELGFFELSLNRISLIVKKGSKEEAILSTFRKGLETIIRNGTYLKILEKAYGTGRVPESVLVDLK